MDINKKIAEELGVKAEQVAAAVQLMDEGSTIPFIARYRKEVTGSLDDEQLRALSERLTYLRNLEEKKEQILKTIEEQGKLTPDLKAKIEAALTQVELEDLYRPYRPKRRTRASIAREKGLEPLALIILKQAIDHPLAQDAERFISEEKGVASAEEAIAGASDILAEVISDNAGFRSDIRELVRRKGVIASEAKDENEKSVYETYYHFSEAVQKIQGYRVLALNRGEDEKILTVKLEVPEEDILHYMERRLLKNNNPYTAPVLKAIIKDSYERLIGPAIEREIRNELTEKAEDGAIVVF